MLSGGGRSQQQWFTPELSVSRECWCLQQMGVFPAAESYPWSLPLQGARGITPIGSFPISQGQRHVSYQSTHQNNTTHSKYNPHCCKHQRRSSVPLMQRSPAQLEDLLQRKGFMVTGEMAREGGSIPASSTSPPAASTTRFMGGSKTLVVDSYATGFLV